MSKLALSFSLTFVLLSACTAANEAEVDGEDESSTTIESELRPRCGDGRCRGGSETCSTCPADCGVCSGGGGGGGGGTDPGPGPGTFTRLGVHPAAAAQSTSVGKVLRKLQGFEGKIYAGFGDYGANTGMIAITPYVLATSAFVNEGTADTEAIYVWKILQGKLYAPAIDTRAGADYAVSGPWQNANPVPSEHAFDMTSLTGSDLWLVGSTYSPSGHAAAWRSVDGGQTWSSMLDQAPVSTTTEDFARFYFVGVLNGQLYVQGHDFYGGSHARSRIFVDGKGWSNGPDILQGQQGCDAQTFNGRFVFRGGCHYSAPVFSFDGTARTSLGGTDFAIADGYLYLLNGTTVTRTSDYKSWQTVASGVPSGTTSITVYDRKLYVGTSSSELYAYSATM
jgi:hypothetical protein